MAAIAGAMLGIVLFATGVLGVVSLAHVLTHSARGQQWLYRRRYSVQVRADVLRRAATRSVLKGRRVLAERLSQPAGAQVRTATVRVEEPLASR